MMKIYAAVVVLILIVVLLQFKRRGKEEYPYKKRVSLLTPAERSFYEVLKKVVKDTEVVLFCKVRILDIVEPTKRGYIYLNKIKSKHVDFLLCRKSDMSPTLAIELDDSSHSLRKERDYFVNKVMEVSGVPLERFKVRVTYKMGSVDEIIRPYLIDMKNNA